MKVNIFYTCKLGPLCPWGFPCDPRVSPWGPWAFGNPWALVGPRPLGPATLGSRTLGPVTPGLQGPLGPPREER